MIMIIISVMKSVIVKARACFGWLMQCSTTATGDTHKAQKLSLHCNSDVKKKPTIHREINTGIPTSNMFVVSIQLIAKVLL